MLPSKAIVVPVVLCSYLGQQIFSMPKTENSFSFVHYSWTDIDIAQDLRTYIYTNIMKRNGTRYYDH